MGNFLRLFFAFLFVLGLTTAYGQTDSSSQAPVEPTHQETIIHNSATEEVEDHKPPVWKPNGIGARYGSGSLWVTYKHYFNQYALEANVGYWSGGFLGFTPRVQLNFVRQQDVATVENLQWYAGLGIHYMQSMKNTSFVDGGFNFVGGVEYKVPEYKVSLFLDAGVQVDFEAKFDKNNITFPGGIGARYRW